jgi:DNA-binding NarL/FixJ family response regulator
MAHLQPNQGSEGRRDAALARLDSAVVAADRITRRRIVSILERGGINVVAQAARPVTLADEAAARPLDAVVVVLEGTGVVALEPVASLRAACPNARVVAVVSEANRRLTREAVVRGVDGLVVAATLHDCLSMAVRAAHCGQIVLPATLRAQLERPVLSAREKQVLALVVLGSANGDIARRLHIAEPTVKSHLRTAFRKLGVRSRSEAAATILDPDEGLGLGVLGLSPAEGTG